MRNELTYKGVLYIRLTSLFPSYKLPRARAWLKNYAAGHYITRRGEEWVSEEGYELCSDDIDRLNPNEIQLTVVYNRVKKTHGVETAELFKKELLRMRAKAKERHERQRHDSVLSGDVLD